MEQGSGISKIILQMTSSAQEKMNDESVKAESPNILELAGIVDFPAKNNDGHRLLLAVKSNDREKVADLLESQCNVNYAHPKTQETPLMAAVDCYERNSGAEPIILRMILAAGGATEMEDSNGDTAFLRACNSVRPDALEVLLEAGCNVLAEEIGGKNALHFLAHAYPEDYEKEEYRRIFKRILDSGATALMDRLDCSTPSLLTPLMLALHLNNPVASMLLIEAGCEVNIKTIYNGEPVTAMYFAASSQIMSPNFLEELRMRGASVEPCTRYRGALRAAVIKAFSDEETRVKALLDAGADATATFRDGLSMLHFAMLTRERPGMVQSLLDAGADPNIKATPACAVDNLTDELMRRTHVRVKDFSSVPLQMAIENRYLTVMRVLLQGGSGFRSSNTHEDLSNALIAAAFKAGNYEALEMLLMAGCGRGTLSSHLAALQESWPQLQDTQQLLRRLPTLARSLRQQCRIAVRRHLVYPRPRDIATLPLPESLKDYLCCSDLCDQDFTYSYEQRPIERDDDDDDNEYFLDYLNSRIDHRVGYEREEIFHDYYTDNFYDVYYGG